MKFFYICLLSIFLVFTAYTFADEPSSYENKWIIIIDDYTTYEEAEQVNDIEEYNAAIVLSTNYENLEPGSYMLIKGKFDNKEEAQTMSEELMNIKGINSCIKYTGKLFDFDRNQYRLTELDEKTHTALVGYTYYHVGDKSPDERRWVIFTDHEEDPEEFPLIRTAQDGLPINDLFVFANEEDIRWSPKSDKFAFIDYEAFYNGGDHQLIIVDVFTGKYISILLHNLIEGRDFGKRSKLMIIDLGWLVSGDVVLFSMNIDFLGTSGDEMIDKHRIEKLGANFGRSDPIIVGDFAVFLKP